MSLCGLSFCIFLNKFVPYNYKNFLGGYAPQTPHVFILLVGLRPKIYYILNFNFFPNRRNFDGGGERGEKSHFIRPYHVPYFSSLVHIPKDVIARLGARARQETRARGERARPNFCESARQRAEARRAKILRVFSWARGARARPTLKMWFLKNIFTAFIYGLIHVMFNVTWWGFARHHQKVLRVNNRFLPLL